MCDSCVSKYTKYQSDQDRDGMGDLCDNCPYTYNPDQEDRDKDGIGYVCEPDRDNDGACG